MLTPSHLFDACAVALSIECDSLQRQSKRIQTTCTLALSSIDILLENVYGKLSTIQRTCCISELINVSIAVEKERGKVSHIGIIQNLTRPTWLLQALDGNRYNARWKLLAEHTDSTQHAEQTVRLSLYKRDLKANPHHADKFWAVVEIAARIGIYPQKYLVEYLSSDKEAKLAALDGLFVSHKYGSCIPKINQQLLSSHEIIQKKQAYAVQTGTRVFFDISLETCLDSMWHN